MKPIQLTMIAFGPYKTKEVIDFRELAENHLFVISGNTGAGKTTIFDGICFALYGSASGSERGNMMLRSDFADDQIHTSVELIFQIHQRTFRVFRQLGHVKAGNKSRTGDKYELFEIVDGAEIPAVDRQIVTEINEKIEALIGLTENQFKQIVMLPQGEFRKLLTSETENKEAILRRLFKTDGYQKMVQKLQEKRAIMEKEYTEKKSKVDTYIHHIPATLPSRETSKLFHLLEQENYNSNQVIEGLSSEVAFYNGKIARDKKAYEKANKILEQKTKEYYQAEALNKQFEEYEVKSTYLEKLIAQTPIFTAKEKKLQAAVRASQIEIYEQGVEEVNQEVKQKKAGLERSEILLRKAEKSKQEAEERFILAKEKQGEREKLYAEIERYKQFLPIVQQLVTTEKTLADNITKEQTLKHQLTEMEKKHQLSQANLEQLEKEMNQADKALMYLPEQLEQRNKLRNHWKLLDDYNQQNQTAKMLDQEVKQKKAAYLALEKQYQSIQERWFSEQASVLANHLHEGESCPVCGSKTHPNKASGQKLSVTREQLEQMNVEVNKEYKQYSELAGGLKSANHRMAELKESLSEEKIEIENVAAQLEKIKQEGQKVSAAIKELEKIKQSLSKQKEEVGRKKRELNQLDLAKHHLQKELHEQQQLVVGLQVSYDEQIKQIPEQSRKLASLENHLQQLEKTYDSLMKAFESANEDYQKKRDSLVNAQTDVKNKYEQLQEVIQRKKKAEVTFHEVLNKSAFTDVKSYQAAKLSEIEQNQLTEQITHFNDEKKIYGKQVKELKTELMDKEKINLSALTEELTFWREQANQFFEEWNNTKKYYSSGISLMEQIKQAAEQVEALEKQFGVITDLYDMLRGQNNKKISFERYLQMEYLEQIIEAANYRLDRLSNGQFRLIRSDRQEQHGKQSGLALDVYDSYTGQYRDVKSLSGGEKFNASLSLALGMSDVIQSFQGNVKIDTMFIDEGFGSLDEESLYKAIDALIDLQKSGRMIGVISHVQELKNSFPAILEVKKTKEGHSTTKFILK